ncbi:acetoacetate--CoA ligase, partial [Vibrio sp. D173a]|nr:acetoacetate--CoA ligase [Vibrio sp. D173a]
MQDSNKSVWQPGDQRIADANLTRFIDSLNLSQLNRDTAIQNYAELHQWSVDQPELFWQNVWQFCGVVGTQGDEIKTQGESRWQQPKS